MLNKIFSRPTNTPAAQNIIIVSGLPRSGTSMMMKILAEGGLEIISDAIRKADENNPNGYFELESVKHLGGGDVSWLANTGGRVIKIISNLLEHLPREYRYKIIFMERQLDEILASQKKMLKNRQEQSQVEDNQMRDEFEKHLVAVKYWLARQPNMDVLYINYNDLLDNPQDFISQVVDFINMPLVIEKMLTVPSQMLYRNRTKNM